MMIINTVQVYQEGLPDAFAGQLDGLIVALVVPPILYFVIKFITATFNEPGHNLVKGILWFILIAIGCGFIGLSVDSFGTNWGGVVFGAILALIGLRFLLFPKKN